MLACPERARHAGRIEWAHKTPQHPQHGHGRKNRLPGRRIGGRAGLQTRVRPLKPDIPSEREGAEPTEREWRDLSFQAAYTGVSTAPICTRLFKASSACWMLMPAFSAICATEQEPSVAPKTAAVVLSGSTT